MCRRSDTGIYLQCGSCGGSGGRWMSEKLVRQSRRHALSAKARRRAEEVRDASRGRSGRPSYVPFGQYTSSASSSAWRMTPWYFSGTFAALRVRYVVFGCQLYRLDGMETSLTLKIGSSCDHPRSDAVVYNFYLTPCKEIFEDASFKYLYHVNSRLLTLRTSLFRQNPVDVQNVFKYFFVSEH